jgi:hypothetical protein
VRVGAVIGWAAALPLGGCRGWQSALDAHAAKAAEVKCLFFLFLAVSVAVWTPVLLVLAATLLRRREQWPDPLQRDKAQNRRYQRRRLFMVFLAASLSAARGRCGHRCRKCPDISNCADIDYGGSRLSGSQERAFLATCSSHK